MNKTSMSIIALALTAMFGTATIAVAAEGAPAEHKVEKKQEHKKVVRKKVEHKKVVRKKVEHKKAVKKKEEKKEEAK